MIDTILDESTSNVSATSHQVLPKWFENILNIETITQINKAPNNLIYNDILRIDSIISPEQLQTKDTFGYKWSKKDTYESEQLLSRVREWLHERYGEPSQYISSFSTKPIVLDAGCGAGMSATEYWKNSFSKIHYLGVDISSAVDVCKQKMDLNKFSDSAFMQANIENLPLQDNSVDIIFSEGVMHHTNNTFATFNSLSKKLKKNGLFMLYVYNKKGPIREFVDDHIREKLQQMTPAEGWDALRPLTQLGKLLGDLNITINIPEEIKLLDIPAGEINLQRLFYWHIFKAYYNHDLTLEEMNHINFDWYAPQNAHRHSIEEIKSWCNKTSLTIVREIVEPAGITIIAKKMIQE